MIARVPANSDPLLVGRQRERASLWRHVEAAVAGRAGVVLLAGEPGIGKTRLLDEIAARATTAGATVLRGGASEAEGMPPYLPFLEALGRHIRSAAPEHLRAQTGLGASTLAAILPELAIRLGELPAGYPLPPEQARLRLYEAVGEFLAAIAAPQPLLLLLDDLQWADAASLDLLCHVARHQPAARLLILGAHREGEVAANPPLERALAELTRLRVLTIVGIESLSAAEVAALAADYLGALIDPAAARLLHTQSEGNPFFAEELLRGWLETGLLAQQGGRWMLTGPLGETLSPSIVGAIRQRLARLSPGVIDDLRTAAIIGRTFDVTVLAAVAGQEVEAVEERLREAVRTRLLRTDQPGMFTFSHDKIRESLYGEVTSVRRRRLHGFIGRALETGPTQEGAHHLADLAFHFTRSGDRARGALYARRAAEQALRTYAPEDAMTAYRSALGLLDAYDPQRGDLLLGLGAAALLSGAEREAAAAFAAAQAWFQQAGDPAAAARAAYGLGQARWRLEELSSAQAAFETALALLEERPLPETVPVLVDLASLLAVSRGRQAEGLAYGQQALALVRRLGDDRREAAASRTVGNLLVRDNDLAAGVPLLERALALAQVADDPVEAAECCACLVIAYLWTSDLRRSHEMSLRRMEFARRCHDFYQLRHANVWLAARPFFQGRWAEVEQLLAPAQSVVERLISPEPLGLLLQNRGLLAYVRGEYAAAEGLLEQSTAIFRAMGPSTLVWYLAGLGLAQLAVGKRPAALACMAEVEVLIAAQPVGSMSTAEALTYLAVMAISLGDRERTMRYYPRLMAFQGQFHDFLVDRLLGGLATLQGDWPAATASLVSAEATARREGLGPELARTLVAWADLALAQGGRGSAERARNQLGQALQLFQELGMTGEASRTRDRLRSLPRQPGTPTHGALPAGLSEREAAVLRLVVAGKSNREIAADLFLSEKTVANHLTAIFNKVGVDNRAGATAFAIRHGLA